MKYWGETSIFKYVWRHSLNKILSPLPSHLLTRVAGVAAPAEIRAKCRSPHFVSTWNEVEIKSLSAQLVINLTASSPCLNSHYPNLLSYNSISNQISKLKFRSLNTRPSMFSSLFSPQFLFPFLSFHHRWLTPTRKPRPSDNILE